MGDQNHPKTYLKLFVFGTLKRGYKYHDLYCSDAIDIEPATVWGRIYGLPQGYPAMEIPESSVLTVGTASPIADAQTQLNMQLTDGTFTRPAGDWNIVHGEIMTFDSPAIALPAIDALEEFDPAGKSMYRRVLIAAQTDSKIIPVWTYEYQFGHAGKRIASGNWPA